MSFKLSIGKTAIAGSELYTNEAIAGLIPTNENQISNEYLFQLFNSEIIDLKNVGHKAFGKSLNSEYLNNEVKIPLPTIDVQQKIVEECNAIDNTVIGAQKTISDANAEIEKKVKDTFKYDAEQLSLSQLVHFNPSKTEIKDLDDGMLVSFIEMASVSNDGFIEHKEDKTLKLLRKGSYTYFANNDIIIAKITPCMENGKCALATGLTNSIALGSSEFHVFRSNEKILPAYLFHHLNRQLIRNEAEKKMTGASGHRRVPITFYYDIKIPLPSLSVQQQLVQQIELLEAQIATERITIENAPAQKQAVLKKWLE